jgi:exodeoxyribonuclease VII large subunit
MDETKAISLMELNAMIKSGVHSLFPNPYWIIAEISEMNSNQSGHCYLELIEKSSDTEQITAKAKATIWAFTFRMLKPYFESVTGQRLTIGLKVMLSVTVEFHELYGFSLNVKDIEPNYTVGDLSRKKQEIIKQLQEEGVFHLNKELEFPIVPQNIAVISSETAAGYGDFVNQLTQNRYNYKYRIKLFNAYMQGADAEKSIINALEQIFTSQFSFDVVVIIRGGGSQSDLNCFNSYWLAYHITQFPIPVITGIGHERDQTISDLVANTSLKTPTAVAEFIIEKTVEFDTYLSELHEAFTDNVTDRLSALSDQLNQLGHQYASTVKLTLTNHNRKIEKYEALTNLTLKNWLKNNTQHLNSIALQIKPKVQHALSLPKREVDQLNKNYFSLLKKQFHSANHRIDEFASRTHLLDPARLLKKGYSLTFNNGVLIKSAHQLKPGDVIMSKWIDGIAESTVHKISINNN